MSAIAQIVKKVEPQGLAAVSPLHTLRRAEPSEA